jgi:hypothetical protein
MRISTAPAAVTLLLLVLAPSAGASSAQESIFQSDQLLTQSGTAVQQQTLNELDSLGVDTIRALALWNRFAPSARSTHRPAGFDGADPAAYDFSILRSLIDGARARGMTVILTPTTPAPAWASGCSGTIATRESCRPSPTEFGRFVHALGAAFPAQRRWAIMNEPNVYTWLQPQYVRRSGRLVPEAARLFRGLVTSAMSALRATGHGAGRDLVIVGETAPAGVSTVTPIARRSTATATFLRGFLCLSASNRRLTGADARNLGCSGTFPRMTFANGIATHPYGRGGSQSPLIRARSDEITLSSLSRLSAIAAAARRYGRVSHSLGLWLTEHGFQTNPPDNRLGVSLSTQAAWINLSEYLAYKSPGVRGLAQYLLKDDRSIDGFQTGLEYASGRVKPSYAAYRLPLWVAPLGSKAVKVFGQARGAADNARERIAIQFRARGARSFRTVTTATTRTRKGFIYVTLRASSGYWRLAWTPSGGGATRYSRIATAQKS